MDFQGLKKGMPIRAKILNIIGVRTFAINAGKLKGITLKMKFEILAPASEGKTAPAVKSRVRVVEVYDKFSLTENYEPVKIKINVGDDLIQIS